MTAEVIPFPRVSEETTRKTLRELRIERGWSLMGAVKALAACATPEERKGLPGLDSLKHNWIRWEAGTTVPDGNRSEPFYRLIIARMFGMDPDELFPPSGFPVKSPALAHASDLRRDLTVRRDQVQREISRLQADLAYLNQVLSVPLPG